MGKALIVKKDVKKTWFNISDPWDIPRGPVVKTPPFHCRGHGFDPWPGNQDPTCHTAWQKKKKERERDLPKLKWK